jgi:radical SAM superfamily enzyme YgiQ (UPF0313 family)
MHRGCFPARMLCADGSRARLLDCTVNIGPHASVSHPFCRCRVPRWSNSAGTVAMSSWSPAMPTSTTPASAWRWSGRLLEAQGFRVGIIAQPDWHERRAVPRAGPAEPLLRHHRRQHGFDGQPLHLRPSHPQRRCLHAGRSAGRRPDRAVIVYAQRCREAYPETCRSCIGGIEASLRRIAHYDYWSDKVRRSVLLDAKADLLLYGNAERQLVELAHRWRGASRSSDHRPARHRLSAPAWPPAPGWIEIDSSPSGCAGAHRAAMDDPYAMTPVRQRPWPASQKAQPPATARRSIRFEPGKRRRSTAPHRDPPAGLSSR